MIVDEVNDD